MKSILKYAALAIVLASWAIGYYYYPRLPELVASHWNGLGEVNGHMNRFWGAFTMPTIITILSLLFLILPFLDPKKANYKNFQKEYDQIFAGLMLFFLVFYCYTLSWNLGGSHNIKTVTSISLAFLFFFIGSVLPRVHQNWFVGIRTPWALENETVWKDTQVFGGRAFQVAAIFYLLGAFLPNPFAWLIVGPILIAAVASVVFSYVRFKQLEAS